MRSILDIAQALPGVTSGGRLLARVLGKGDIADPAAIWCAVPEAALNSLNPEQKVAYIETLLPLVHRSRGVKLPHLRRLYQLFTFMKCGRMRASRPCSASITGSIPLNCQSCRTKLYANRFSARQSLWRAGRQLRRRDDISLA